MINHTFAPGDYVYFNGGLVEVRLCVVDYVRTERNGTYIVARNGQLIHGVKESELSHESPIVVEPVSMIDRLARAVANCER
jgi:hypothetical protein